MRAEHNNYLHVLFQVAAVGEAGAEKFGNARKKFRRV